MVLAGGVSVSGFQPLTYVSDRDKLLVHIGTEQFMSSITFQIKQPMPNDDKVFHMRNVHYITGSTHSVWRILCNIPWTHPYI